ncbi:MAG: YkuS family protein [Tissierellia bacterium]|nr:YkuS family protein [Tissierellia bacterium]
MRKIGVEKGLSNVVDYLTNEGYSVEVLSESIDNNIPKLKEFDAIVTAGYNTDMLGISDTETQAPVVNAKGLTPEEVKAQLEQRLV